MRYHADARVSGFFAAELDADAEPDDEFVADGGEDS
jgi:hypothetical protein